MSGTYLNQKQRFTGVFNRLQKNVYSWVSFLIKLHAFSLIKQDGQNNFPVQNTFFAKHVWLESASAKHHFLCCVDLISKILLSALVMLWLSLNIFIANTASRLWTAVSWSPRQLVDLFLIKQAIRPKCC